MGSVVPTRNSAHGIEVRDLASQSDIMRCQVTMTVFRVVQNGQLPAELIREPLEICFRGEFFRRNAEFFCDKLYSIVKQSFVKSVYDPCLRAECARFDDRNHILGENAPAAGFGDADLFTSC